MSENGVKNSFVSCEAICPYYRCEKAYSIFCTGYSLGMHIALSFDDKNDCREYKNRFCKSYDYVNCPLAILNEKYACEKTE